MTVDYAQHELDRRALRLAMLHSKNWQMSEPSGTTIPCLSSRSLWERVWEKVGRWLAR